MVTTIILVVPIFILRYLNVSNWPFLVGCFIGVILPDIDHYIYVYYLRPYEVTSQRVMYDVKKGNLWQSWDLLSATRSERTNLILHSILFQVLFLILSFLIISSSSSLLGKGLVLAFLLHLLVDQYLDLKSNGNLANWFKNIPIQLDTLQLNLYLIFNLAAILIFGFLL